MAGRARLDAELGRRGLAGSRAQPADLIEAGHVLVAGQAAEKAATQVGQDAAILVRPGLEEPPYASRGGRKLAGALTAFPDLSVAGRQCLDAGASTGGFTGVLLRAGAAPGIAGGAGYRPPARQLRVDPRGAVLGRGHGPDLRPPDHAPAPPPA